MSSVLDDWKARLVTLSPHERAEPAHFLLGSLGPEEEGVEAARDEEVSRRVDAIRSGSAPGRDADVFLAGLRGSYP